MMEKWLSQSKFLCGETMTIADISAACELHQIKFLKKSYEEYPHLNRWMKEMHSLPQMKDVHKFVNVAIKKAQKMRAKL